MNYIDEILERYNDEGDKIVHELYCQNNINTLSNLTVDDFEDIYYALFDDEIDKLLKAEGELNNFNIEEYEEYIDILLTELVGSAMEEYSYVKFLAEIPKTQWNDIITENINGYQKKSKSQRIYDFYQHKVRLECKLK